MRQRAFWESAGFLASKAALGEVALADELLLDVTSEIAGNAEGFPLVEWPGVRMAAPQGQKWAVFFRIVDTNFVELLWVCSFPNIRKAA